MAVVAGKQFMPEAKNISHARRVACRSPLGGAVRAPGAAAGSAPAGGGGRRAGGVFWPILPGFAVFLQHDLVTH